MPILGPGTVRSTSGFAVDSGIHFAITTALDLPQYIDHGDTIQTGITVLKAIDNRHQQPFRYYDSGYPFEYYMVRFLYREKRELAVMK
jgi:phospholipid-binding lipoprotein MlaA